MWKGSRIDTYDKLHGMEHQKAEKWNECCPVCKSKNLEIVPIGISYKPHTVNFDGLPEQLHIFYKNLPNITQAILKVIDGEKSTRISIKCDECNYIASDFENKKSATFGDPDVVIVDSIKLKRYLNKYYKIETVMIL